MKRLAYAGVGLLLAMSFAPLAADGPDRPTGVTADNWVPVSARLGIVLVESSAPTVGANNENTVIMEEGGTVRTVPRDRTLLLKPPVGGYFMVKGAGGWTRLVVIEPIKGPGDVG